jgi:hypothetical protein
MESEAWIKKGSLLFHGGVDTAESATLTAEDVSAYAERADPNINARGPVSRC